MAHQSVISEAGESAEQTLVRPTSIQGRTSYMREDGRPTDARFDSDVDRLAGPGANQESYKPGEFLSSDNN